MGAHLFCTEKVASSSLVCSIASRLDEKVWQPHLLSPCDADRKAVQWWYNRDMIDIISTKVIFTIFTHVATAITGFLVGVSYRRKHRERAAQQRKENTRKAVDLLGGKCEICGLVDDPIVYDFHHKNPAEKEYAVSRGISYKSWDSLKQEVKKCTLLCCLCHRKLHYPHGKGGNGNWTSS